MLRVVIHDAATADIDEYAAYLAERSLAAGDRFYERVFETAEWLAHHPGGGHRLRLRHNAGIRVFGIRGFPNHLIFYRTKNETLEVVRVSHGARDLPRVLRATIRRFEDE